MLLFFKQLSTVKISMIKHAYPDFGFLAFCLPVGSYKNQLLYQILIPLFFFFSEQKVNAIRCSAWTWPESRIFTNQRKLLGAHLYMASCLWSCSIHPRLLPRGLSVNVVMARIASWAQAQKRLFLASLASIWDWILPTQASSVGYRSQLFIILIKTSGSYSLHSQRLLCDVEKVAPSTELVFSLNTVPGNQKN